MNYLAHARLSFGNDSILVGNMISDFVKGKKKFEFPLDIQKGIMLHRSIDIFTDAHTVTKNITKVFKPSAGAYAVVFTDIVYDHFLAKDEKEFPSSTLEDFARETYKILTRYNYLLPDKFRLMLPYMISQNWLLNYKFIPGVMSSFNGVFRRAKYIDLDKKDEVHNSFIESYELLRIYFEEFFPAVKDFAFAEFNKLLAS